MVDWVDKRLYVHSYCENLKNTDLLYIKEKLFSLLREKGFEASEIYNFNS